MRKLLLGLVLVVLVAVVAVAAFLFIPSPLQKWAVERGATLATGRQVTMGEPFRLRAWPPVEISAAEIRVANADWGSAPDLATISALDAKIDLLAFWRDGRVAIERLAVTRPQVNLEVGQDGRQNWTLGGDEAAGPAAGDASAQQRTIPAFVLGDIRVDEGSVGYDDRAAGTSRKAEAIRLAISQSGPDQPVAIDGGLTLDGKPATLTGTVARPQGAAAGERSPIRVEFGVPGATASFDGEIETSVPAAGGAVAIQVPATPDLVAFLGGGSPPAGLPGSVSMEGRLDLARDRIALTDLRLQADQITGSGEAAVALAEPPRVTADLAFGTLDLTPFLDTAPAAAKAPPQPPSTDGIWSDAPIDLPLPLPVDLDVRLRGEGLRAGKLEIGAFKTRLEADRERAVVTIEELRVYGGGLTGRVAAEPGTPPVYTVNLDGDGIGVLAASQALTGLSRFDGRAQVGLALTSRGASQRELVQQLGGDGRIILRDGAVIGINIAGMLRQVMTLGLNPGAVRQQRTDFAEAGASFRVENGILRTRDLRLRAPVLRLDGAGAVDLPKLTVDMRITPQLASTLQGQDARGDPAFQAGLPFLVQGPYTSPSVRFDLDGTLTRAISSPADVARLAADLTKSPEAVRLLRGRFDLLRQLPTPAAAKALEAFGDALGGGGSAKGQKRPEPSDLGNAARGLLKGLTGQ